MRRNRVYPLLFAGLFAAGGCARALPVEVVVNLDGKPVAGATVSLYAEEGGGQPASGYTLADGTATLTAPGDKGVPPGNYKVLVSKRASVGAAVEVNPDNPREAMMKVGSKAAKESGAGRSRPGMPPGMQGMGMGQIKTKAELPEDYEDPRKTPLTLKVPPDSSPVVLELKTKP